MASAWKICRPNKCPGTSCLESLVLAHQFGGFADRGHCRHQLCHRRRDREWSALVCSNGVYAAAFPEEDRKRAMKWLKMHAQYDDAHPWEALEIICTLAGHEPEQSLADWNLRQAMCKSYDYMYLFLERCMQLELPSA
jgi:hypothetical protein